LLDAAGVGVSHCLGVGGRDLSAAVAGRSTLAALAALDADPATELIVLVSKPPAAAVADLVRARAAELATPVVFALLGADQPDLTQAVEQALHQLGHPVPDLWPAWLPAAEPGAAARAGHDIVALAGFDVSRDDVAAPASPVANVPNVATPAGLEVREGDATDRVGPSDATAPANPGGAGPDTV